MRIHLDFESRSSVEIWNSGAWVYSRSASTEILCICFAVDDEPVTTITFEDLQKELNRGTAGYQTPAMSRLNRLASKEDVIFVAFNAYFEQCVWKNILTPRFGIPPVGIKRWRCVQSKTNTFGLPSSLEKAALAYGVTQQKDMSGKNFMLKLAKPRLARKTDVPGQIYWNDSVPEDWQALYEYCRQDVEVERELDAKIPDLSPQELNVWFVDQTINLRGVRTDVEFVNKVREMLTTHNARMNSELRALTNNFVGAGTEVARIVKYLQMRGIDLKDLTKETVTRLIESGELDAHAIQVLRYRQELGKSSNAKYEKLHTATDAGGVVRDCFVYHQASTGRWGSKLVQLQNLPVNRQKIDELDAVEQIKTLDYPTLRFIYGDKLNAVASACIRSVFIPRPGNKFLVVDYSAIEARVVMWLAGEEGGLKEFQNADAGKEVEIYVRMARRIYNNPALTKEDKNERQLGKTVILACSYQMGGPRFFGTCQQFGLKNVDEQMAIACVDLYRRTYPAVVRFWYAMNQAAIDAVNHPGQTIPCGEVSWYYRKDRNYLFMRLPSGRFLAYQAPRIESGEYGAKLTYMTEFKTNWVRQDTYGGALVENCLTKDTQVPTLRGIIPITEVQKGDQVWDGLNWVITGGIVNRGIKNTGRLGGLGVTADHLILVGSLWKSAISVDEDSWQDALKSGLSSGNWWLRYQDAATIRKQNVNAPAETGIGLKQGHSSGELVSAKNADMPINQNSSVSLTMKKLNNFGAAAGQVSYPDAQIRNAKAINTTGEEGLTFSSNHVKSSWSTAKLFLAHMLKTWTWTVSTIIEAMSGAISDLLLQPKTPITSELTGISPTAEKNILSQNFIGSTAQNGKGTTPYFGTSRMGNLPNGLWKDTGRQEEVYDLMDCGPLHRFTVISNQGPIIVHNCTQAVARDLLAYSMPKLEAANLPIALHVHDEIVCESPDENRLQEMIKVMTELPDWAAGLPIKAEGFVAHRYIKK